jgi:hypothetical protein
MQELFKEHPIYAIKVSNFGNVKTLEDKNFKVSKNQRYIRLQAVNKTNYEIKFLSIHRLVAELFINFIPKDMVVNHIDGNKHNNNVKNLEIISYKENTQHAYKLGLIKNKYGEKHYNNKLEEIQIIEIYKLIKQGFVNKQISDIMKVDFRTISLIRTGKRWKHLFNTHMKEVIESKGTNKDLSFCFKVIEDLGILSNIQISKKYNLEPSLVSRVRSKQTWISVWNKFEKSATTISKESTLQANGSGKAENPNE